MIFLRLNALLSLGTWLLLAAILVAPAASQPKLYALEFTNVGGAAFSLVDSADGSTVATVSLSGASGLAKARGMAFDPTTDLLWAINLFFDANDHSQIHNLSITDGSSTSHTSLIDIQLRDITFDDNGQMWAVTVNLGDTTVPVIPIDHTTPSAGVTLAEVTGEFAAIAYRRVDGKLYTLSQETFDQSAIFQSIDRVTGAKTPITLSGDTKDGSIRGLAWNSLNDIFFFYVINSGGGEGPPKFYSISPSGFVTELSNPAVATPKNMGLDFLPELFSDGFETGDTLRWSSSSR